MEAFVPDKPEKSLSSGVLLGGQFIANEILNGLRLGGSCELAVSDFLVRQMLANCSQTSIIVKEGWYE